MCWRQTKYHLDYSSNIALLFLLSPEPLQSKKEQKNKQECPHTSSTMIRMMVCVPVMLGNILCMIPDWPIRAQFTIIPTTPISSIAVCLNKRTIFVQKTIFSLRTWICDLLFRHARNMGNYIAENTRRKNIGKFQHREKSLWMQFLMQRTAGEVVLRMHNCASTPRSDYVFAKNGLTFLPAMSQSS